MLPAGTRLGPYEVVSPLGEGGMGEVYRGRDTRLGREVAIKVVRGAVPSSPEARQRFEREARTVSGLNHPHICTLHDVGREGEIDYLVMELVEGETLAQRVSRSALPTPEVLRLGIQIAGALERAHRAGIVHRDLKPGNVMVAKSGAKLMDFGLARIRPATGVGAGSVSPTLEATAPRPITEEGAILGTIQYLAPEQLEEGGADARSDVWALGCVLYEMTTGRPAFEGRSRASVVAAIMNLEPAPMAQRSPLAPPALDRLVRACLAKDPDERMQTAHDVRIGLEWVRDGEDASGTAKPPAARRGWRERLAWGLAAAGALAAVALGFQRPGAPAPAVAVRVSIQPPANEALTTWSSSLAASPDGRRLAFIASSRFGDAVWIRSLDSEGPKDLPVTGGAHRQVFWSPDGANLAFFAPREGRQRLLKIPADGGNATTLCEVVSPRGGSWNRRGDILLAPAAQGPLFRIHAGGGELRPATVLDSTRGETSHRFPCFLPDDDHFLFASLPLGPGGYTIYVGSLRGGRPRRLMTAESSPVFAAPGALLFLRKGEVTAQRFDPRRLALVGEPVTITGAPAPSDMDAEPVATASRTGNLFILRNPRIARRLVWIRGGGAGRDTLDLPYGYWQVLRLSPDGRRACAWNDGYWVIDLARATPTMIATSPTSQEVSMAWSPDGRRIAFASTASGRVEIYLANADGTGAPELLPTTDAQFKSVLDWTPDGKGLVFGTLEERSDWDVWTMPLDGSGGPRRLVSGPGFDGDARLSPDGRWMAYTSTAREERDVFVQSFPSGDHRTRVSRRAGQTPRWTDSGRALVYSEWDTDQQVPLVSGESPVLGTQRQLLRYLPGEWHAEFGPDGRGLTSFGIAQPRRDIKAVLGWTALLAR